MATALEKKYQRARDEAVAFAVKEFGCEPEAAIVSFAEHECVVDVMRPGQPSHRFIYCYDED